MMEESDMCLSLIIADDEDIVRNSLEKYILLHTERFAKVYTAANGRETLELVLRYKPDIMLLDVQMPGLNGLEVLNEASKAGCMPVTVIFSGYDEFAYAQEALRYGAKDYILKPSRSSHIFNRLMEIADEVESQKNGDSTSIVTADRTNLIGRAKEYIDCHYYENITQTQVADNIGITPGYLSTLFTKNTGLRFADYLNQVRINHACAYLRQNYLKTYEIAFKVGFRDEKYFSKVFKKLTGVSPKEYRNGKTGNIAPF